MTGRTAALLVLVTVLSGCGAAADGKTGAPGPAPPGAKACAVVQGDTGSEAASHVEFRLTDGDGCVVPIRHGDEGFGAEHIRRRDGEVGDHPLDAAARRRMDDALDRPGHQIDGTFYAFAAPGDSDETQCVFVDFRRYDGYARKGVITSYTKTGSHGARGCD